MHPNVKANETITYRDRFRLKCAWLVQYVIFPHTDALMQLILFVHLC